MLPGTSTGYRNTNLSGSQGEVQTVVEAYCSHPRCWAPYAHGCGLSYHPERSQPDPTFPSKWSALPKRHRYCHLKKYLLCIYLTPLGLHYSMWDLFFFFAAPCGILVTWPGVEPRPPALGAGSQPLVRQGSPLLAFKSTYEKQTISPLLQHCHY